MGQKYTKKFLLKELAKRADFSVSDVRVLWDTFEELIEEMIVDGDSLMIGGLFKIYVKTMKPHLAYDINTKETKEVGNRYRLVITSSATLRRALRNRIREK